jgi:NADP-dependent 3-hydroxy acid dehydrogenase YdfG
LNSSVKTVLITGASSGIGMALAIFYAKQHYRVFACARSRNKLGVLAEQYPNIKPLVFDITDKKAVTQQCQTLSELDLVILNAGDCEYMDDVQQFDAQLFERIVQTNLISCGYLLQQLAYKIVQKGQLVFVGSSVT